LGAEEGFEMNLLGVNMGLDFSPIRLSRPVIGVPGNDNLQQDKP